MKKVINWVLPIAFLVFVVDWAVMGVKIFMGNYDVIAEAYVGLASFLILFVCIVIKRCCGKCPHCGKVIGSVGKYCPYCGKER